MSTTATGEDGGSRTADVRFVVTYKGPAVDAGRMDAQTLGAAMLSMAQLLETSAGLTFGASTKLDVDVVADFRRGSFSYVIITSADIREWLVTGFNLEVLLSIIGITGTGLIQLVRWLRRRPITAVTPVSTNPELREVTTIDGDSNVYHAQTIILFQNSKVRAQLDGVVEPLRKEGIDELLTGREDIAETIVQKEDVEFFEPPPPEGETLLDRVTMEIVEILGVAFVAGRKWRFRMPDGTAFTSTIDEDFARDVERHRVTFGAHDLLEVDLHLVVIRDPSQTLHALREIEKVHRLIPAGKPQLDLLNGGGSA